MRKERAFTLIEILVVVVLLGILAVVVLPLVANSSISAKESALALDLQMLRRYVLIYKTQHMEVGPGYPDGDTTQAPTEDVFVAQTTMSSNKSGETAADFPGNADNSHGWIYKASTSEFRSDSTGTSDSGKAYYDY